jgi:hypothetical protein
MTMTVDSPAPIATTSLSPIAGPPRQRRAKRKGASDPAAQTARTRQAIEKLEDQNHRAAAALQAMTSLWLSADATRRRAEAEVALNHFEAALSALRKSLPSM